jgi:hypothetical protein
MLVSQAFAAHPGMTACARLLSRIFHQEKEAPMGERRPEHPTEEQKRELWETRGTAGSIADILRERLQGTPDGEEVKDAPAPEALPVTDTRANQPEPAKNGAAGGAVRAGTLVFGAFSAISLVAGISKGLPLIYLFEAAGWAVAAWYWQRKRTHSELAKGTVVILAVVVAIGEVVLIASQAGSKSSSTTAAQGSDPLAEFKKPSPTTATQSDDPYAEFQKISPANATQGGDPYAKSSSDPYAEFGGHAVYETAAQCPPGLPAGVSSRPLPASDLINVAGLSGSLIFESDSIYSGGGGPLVPKAQLEDKNKTSSCLSTTEVELELNQEGKVSKERHSLVFDPFLAPGQTRAVQVTLSIRTIKRSENLTLSEWQIISASGFKP